jgi:hypothetical protein
MNIEIMKFEASERALQNEIKNNPQECRSCRAWQSAGEMASCMRHCESCTQKKAHSSIRIIIEGFAREHNLTYVAAWDIAYTILHYKQTEYKDMGRIYFDEDYFENDLIEGFKNYQINTMTKSLNVTQKYVDITNPVDKVTINKGPSFVKKLTLTIKSLWKKIK